MNNYQDVERKVEDFLSTLSVYNFLGEGLYRLLPVNSDRLVSLGETSLILSIPGTGMVSRIIGYREPNKHIHLGFYGLWGLDVTENIESTTKCLQDMGFDIVTKLHPYKRHLSSKISGPEVVYLSADLRDNGKNQVMDISETKFHSLDNGAELREQYIESKRRILSAINSGKYHAEVLSHDNKNKYEEAIKHIFFVVKSISENTGSLVIEDLEHIVIRY